MKSKNNKTIIISDKAPVIIGGFGGSGTRVVAEILKKSNFFIGSDLNESNDNLLFTFLFKFPKKYENIKTIGKYNKEITSLLLLHENLFFNKRLSFKEKLKIIQLAYNHSIRNYYYPLKWSIQRILKIITTNKKEECGRWGFKEPHTAFFINNLGNFYPNAKYILVIRNGLDIIYTKTDQQFKYWGDFFNIKNEGFSEELQKFNYWYNYNKYTLVTLERLFKDRYLVLNYEQLFLNREETAYKILKFIGAQNTDIDEIIKFIQMPNSYNRYKNHNLSWINQEIKNKLLEFNYKV